MLLLALVPTLISNRLFEQSPDRIVIDNKGATSISLLRLSFKGHPNAIVTIENIAAHRQSWRLFNRKWLSVTPHRKVSICVRASGLTESVLEMAFSTWLMPQNSRVRNH